MHASITAAAGFLVAVLWFDLMFDVQVLDRGGRGNATDAAVESIASYYRRVTTDASPMGRLVGLVMVTLLVLLAVQAVRDGTPAWVSVASMFAAWTAVALAAARVVPRAVRLGSRADPPDVRAALATSILRGHQTCLVLMVCVLTVQLVGGR